MFVIVSTILSSVIGTPILIASSVISKLYSIITRNNPIDVSRPSFIREISKYIETTNKRMCSKWVCNGKVHALCRYATVFSGFDPIVFIHGTGSSSFNFVEIMEKFPKTHDVFCIDLPGWGISEDPLFDLETADQSDVFAYYGETIMSAMKELYIAGNAKYIFVGHSFGSLILLKSIHLGNIPRNVIHKCVLTSLPGIVPLTSTYPYLWGTIFMMGWLESMFKQWWSPYLFRAFLFRGSSELNTLQKMSRFIPNGKGYQFVSRQMTFRGLLPPIWAKLSYNELVNVAYTNKVELIGGTHDSIVDINPMRYICNCKLYELNGGHSLFLDRSLHIKLIDIIDDFKPDKPTKSKLFPKIKY
jgi:pimeloyl-ACP methyl ester carboxylesterase